MQRAVYLDHNATTPVDPEVLQTMLPFFSETFGNAASKTHVYGWSAQGAVEQARLQTAGLIGAEAGEIIFTSGATESVNLALKGAFEAYRSKGNHFITLATEHRAVLDSCEHLRRLGAKVTVLPVQPDGLVSVDLLRAALRPDTVLVSVMYANNETGVIQPIQEIAETVRRAGALFMSDATQAAGKIRLDVNESGIDLLCLSAHKFYGPKGTGALYVRRRDPRVSLIAQQDGGGHERGLRSGTLNVPGIVGLGKAAELAASRLWDDAGRISQLRATLEQLLIDDGGVSVNGSTRSRLPNTTNLCFHGVPASQLIADLKSELAVAAGSACTSALPQPSHVLLAMGRTEQDAYSSLRFSLGRTTTEEDIRRAAERVIRSVQTLRQQHS